MPNFAGVIRARPGIQVGASTADFGGGVGVLGIDDAGTVPTTNPTGGVVVYSEAGVLKWRDPAGVVHVVPSSPGWFNVKDYGALGDNSTNDRAAIQAAIDAVPSTGGVVWFPPGTYVITTALTLKANLTLAGVGINASIIKQTATTLNALAGVDVHTITIHNLQIQGPNSGSGNGIVLTRSSNPNTKYIRLDNVYIRQFGNDGIAISNCIVSKFDRVTAENCGRHGFYLYGVTAGAAGTSVAFDACYANTNTTTGFNLYNMVYTELSGCASEGHPTNFLIDTCQSVALTGCGSEVMAASGAGFKITGGFGITLTSCWDFTNRGKAFWLTGSTYAINLIGIVENSPGAGVTASLKVDTGCAGINLHAISNVTAMSLAAGTTNILNDGANGLTIHGYLYTDAAAEFNGAVTFDQGTSFYGTLDLASGIEDLTQISSPANPAAGKTRLFAKTGDQLFFRNSAGAERLVSAGLLFPFSRSGLLTVATGAHRIYNDTGTTLTIKGVRATAGTAPTGASIIVDINIDGTTIFSTQGNRPTIAISGFTSGKVTNMNTTTIADGSYFTVDVDQVGSTIAGSNLVVQVLC